MIKQLSVIVEVQPPDREEAVNVSYEDRDVLQVHGSDFFKTQRKKQLQQYYNMYMRSRSNKR